MAYLGDYNLGTTLYTKFTTVNASGLPAELSAPACVFYQDANTTAFPTASGGLSCDASWNSTTGLNHAQMILTTSVTGIVTGSSYQLVISTGTVSGVNMKGYVIGEFSIRKRSALMPATAGQNVVVDSNGIVAANVTAASINIGAVITASSINIGAIITASSINIGAVVTACNTIVPANVTAASINIGAVVTAINTIANANVTSISTIVPANITASSINIGAIVTAANTNIGAVVTAVNTITPARVTAQGIDIGAIVTAANTNVGAVVTAMNTIANANVTSFSASGIGTLYTISPNITYASATTTSLLRALVTGVWDEPGANHTTAGSLGQELNSAGAGGDPWQTAIPGAYVAGQAGFIVGNRVDVSVGSRLATGATVASVSVLGTVAGVSAVQTVTANILAVAGVAVSGFGTVGSPWGP